RHPEEDFLYADELKAFEEGGITELHTAFSRGDGPKTYVQHLVAAQKDRVWSLIEQDAIIYVCGDGSKMEPDVKAALVAIYRERSGADADAGQRWIDDLGAKNRYVLDVWAGGENFLVRWLHPSRRAQERAPQDEVSAPHGEERGRAARLEPCGHLYRF